MSNERKTWIGAIDRRTSDICKIGIKVELHCNGPVDLGCYNCQGRYIGPRNFQPNVPNASPSETPPPSSND